MKRVLALFLVLLAALTLCLPAFSADGAEEEEEAELIEIEDGEVPLSAVPFALEGQSRLVPGSYTAAGIVLMVLAAAGIFFIHRRRARLYDDRRQRAGGQIGNM